MASQQEIIEILIKVRDEQTKKLNRAQVAMKDLGHTTRNFDKQLKKVNKTQGQLDSITKKNQVQFAGWAMSIMFFGMALKRIFSQIWKFASKTFQDVQHSVEGTTTGFDMLQGSLKYLGFTIGEALETVVTWLMPIIDSISDWVSKHQELTAGIVVSIGVLGTLFATLGAGKLALDGFTSAFQLMGGSASGALAFLSNPAVLAGAAAIAAIAVVSWKSFKETPEAWKAVKDTLAELDLTPVKDSFIELSKTIFPDVKVGWEDIAWATAWYNTIYKNFVQAYVNYTATFINAIILTYNALDSLSKMIEYVFSFGTRGSKADIAESMDLAKESLSDLMVTSKAFGSNVSAIFKTATTSIEDFKNQTLEAKKVTDASSLSGSYTGGYSAKLPQSNIKDLYLTGKSSNETSMYGENQQSVQPVVNVYVDNEPAFAKIMDGAQSTWSG